MADLNFTRHLGRRLVLVAASVCAISLVATPAQADPIFIGSILALAGLPTTVSVFGITVGVANILSGLVTTPTGHGLHIRSYRQ